ncbi:hypothetical protein Metho_2720 (plasmid) [Methanomethylovorans hollandica DSM 15978]|jgi:hypothetical protein|uniref:Uncharacterized protein n=1 Tax=Methanomethylovorans hollandica (strain DSM 15978 / NBRC 107637 / DMS1) TaxID=867904 RepID=L0L375_METHD|nr:hypothetical protein [Methanomethylovorans hollandica]AGB50848.1 hypothetical protein Metho_2720 [Methanomethylovorans hollandica DSM 15978]
MMLTENEFNKPASRNTDYSLVEYDLAARLGLSLRKNLKENTFEIFDIKSGEVIKKFTTFSEAIKECNLYEINNCR